MAHFINLIIGVCLKIPSTFEFDDPQIQEGALEIAVRLIIYLDNLDPEEDKKANMKPSVLVFLPGIHEIEDMHERLKNRVMEK